MSIHNIINILNNIDPNSLRAIKLSYPDHSDLFEMSKTLGEGDGAQGASIDDINVRCEIVAVTLPSLQQRCSELMDKLTARLRASSKLKLFVAFMTLACNGGGIFASRFSGKWVDFSFFLACIAFISGVCSIIIEGMDGKNSETKSYFAKVSDISVKLSALARENYKMSRTGWTLEGIDDFLGRLDIVAQSLDQVSNDVRVA